ncbi:uncharacterized protein MYCFIDRAFT_175079 [Pseudocercospora fijiensis CIRAD86]|uniref:Structure-specific endonuclease subunit SLX4 n=1 Tax=Pseudocercospora fijiensis (strain CIRAD86) TaxID=383855 RepID=M3AGE4_PSEFD|nr:uncharacterized protein MYCFIDRAFT_175079 [Pseudocercospora fijiensis CIRAD86]EME83651.1 hypothetical protein MYCFIDRAFT_175079 [Pseudocercospora fijiensis CIRAD86]
MLAEVVTKAVGPYWTLDEFRKRGPREETLILERGENAASLVGSAPSLCVRYEDWMIEQALESGVWSCRWTDQILTGEVLLDGVIGNKKTQTMKLTAFPAGSVKPRYHIPGSLITLLILSTLSQAEGPCSFARSIRLFSSLKLSLLFFTRLTTLLIIPSSADQPVFTGNQTGGRRPRRPPTPCGLSVPLGIFGNHTHTFFINKKLLSTLPFQIATDLTVSSVVWTRLASEAACQQRTARSRLQLTVARIYLNTRAGLNQKAASPTFIPRRGGGGELANSNSREYFSFRAPSALAVAAFKRETHTTTLYLPLTELLRARSPCPCCQHRTGSATQYTNSDSSFPWRLPPALASISRTFDGYRGLSWLTRRYLHLMRPLTDDGRLVSEQPSPPNAHTCLTLVTPKSPFVALESQHLLRRDITQHTRNDSIVGFEVTIAQQSSNHHSPPERSELQRLTSYHLQTARIDHPCGLTSLEGDLKSFLGTRLLAKETRRIMRALEELGNRRISREKIFEPRMDTARSQLEDKARGTSARDGRNEYVMLKEPRWAMEEFDGRAIFEAYRISIPVTEARTYKAFKMLICTSSSITPLSPKELTRGFSPESTRTPCGLVVVFHREEQLGIRAPSKGQHALESSVSIVTVCQSEHILPYSRLLLALGDTFVYLAHLPWAYITFHARLLSVGLTCHQWRGLAKSSAGFITTIDEDFVISCRSSFQIKLSSWQDPHHEQWRPKRARRHDTTRNETLRYSMQYRTSQASSLCQAAFSPSDPLEIPVVIDSSSPAAFRPPTISPQQTTGKTESTTQASSSPGLPSPSALFAKSRTSGQQRPEGANKGFASAASLVKSNCFGASVEASKEDVKRQAEDGGDRGATESTGKLPRPKKPETAEKARPERQRRRSTTPFDDYAFLAPSPASRRVSRSPKLASPIVLNPPSDALQRPGAPSISFSEHDFRPGQQSPSEAVLPIPKAAKKARKSKAANAGSTSDKPARRPKKKAAKVVGEKKSDKSVSFILNSDDLASTQFAALEAKDVQGERTVGSAAEDHGDVEHTKAKPRPKKAPKTAVDEGERASKLPQKNSKTKSSTHASEVQFDQQSAFFAPAKKSTDVHLNTSPFQPIPPHRGEHEAADLDTLPAPAHRRRLSWTPVKNTSAPAFARPDTACSNTSADAERPTLCLADVIGSFGYASEDKPPPIKRTHSGEALAKRRRVGLTDDATRPPAARKAEVVQPPPAVEPKKRERAPKKKPQTITDLATKAYRPEDVAPAPVDQQTVSSFFVPNAQAEATAHEVPAAEDQGTTKVKKPRKSRAKKADVDGAVDTSKPKKAKTAKAKVRFNEADYLAQLYRPEEARAEEKRQDFLFGTSSQLGGEDSPTFIRQIQMAVRESESIPAVQNGTSPARKSCMKVISASHGTGLSVGQGSKEHWCSAARGQDGETLDASYDRPTLKPHSAPPPKTNTTEEACSGLVPPQLELKHLETGTFAKFGAPGDDGPDGDPVSVSMEPAHGIVNLCSSSPTAVPPELRHDDRPAHTVSGLLHAKAAPREASSRSGAKGDLFESKTIDSKDAPTDPRPTPPWSPSRKAQLPSLKRSATSPIRPALQMLDNNIHSPLHTSSHKTGSIALCRTLIDDASPAEGKRPKANAIVEATTPKRRGRPPKQRQAIPHRVSPLKLSPAFKSASQPASPPKYINIDEISDSDETPSPPRARANSSPPSIRTLDITTIPAPTILSSAKLKPDDAAWPSIAATLFPKISFTIRSTPPSTDLQNPSWHEKILLYDPIVLEDLTVWLNERGVRLEVRKVKALPRKRKGEGEFEVVECEVVPWMVQKWWVERGGSGSVLMQWFLSCLAVGVWCFLEGLGLEKRRFRDGNRNDILRYGRHLSRPTCRVFLRWEVDVYLPGDGGDGGRGAPRAGQTAFTGQNLYSVFWHIGQRQGHGGGGGGGDVAVSAAKNLLLDMTHFRAFEDRMMVEWWMGILHGRWKVVLGWFLEWSLELEIWNEERDENEGLLFMSTLANEFKSACEDVFEYWFYTDLINGDRGKEMQRGDLTYSSFVTARQGIIPRGLVEVDPSWRAISLPVACEQCYFEKRYNEVTFRIPTFVAARQGVIPRGCLKGTLEPSFVLWWLSGGRAISSTNVKDTLYADGTFRVSLE